MNREDLIRLAREAAGGPSRPTYCQDPETFEPHDWVIDAMNSAYRCGHFDGERFRQVEIDKARR